MCMGQQERFSLPELIQHCTNPASPHWELAWREFLHKYKRYIYKVITVKVLQWNDGRLKLQIKEVVNDIFLNVLTSLCDRDGKILTNFRAVDKVEVFRAWLGTISANASTRYLQKYYRERFAEEGPENYFNLLTNVKTEARWELYETLVRELRENAGTSRRNSERDIHIFMLNKWADYSIEMIEAHPSLMGIGEQVLYNVINRLRSLLKNFGE